MLFFGCWKQATTRFCNTSPLFRHNRLGALSSAHDATLSSHNLTEALAALTMHILTGPAQKLALESDLSEFTCSISKTTGHRLLSALNFPIISSHQRPHSPLTISFPSHSTLLSLTHTPSLLLSRSSYAYARHTHGLPGRRPQWGKMDA